VVVKGGKGKKKAGLKDTPPSFDISAGGKKKKKVESRRGSLSERTGELLLVFLLVRKISERKRGHNPYNSGKGGRYISVRLGRTSSFYSQQKNKGNSYFSLLYQWKREKVFPRIKASPEVILRLAVSRGERWGRRSPFTAQ